MGFFSTSVLRFAETSTSIVNQSELLLLLLLFLLLIVLAQPVLKAHMLYWHASPPRQGLQVVFRELAKGVRVHHLGYVVDGVREDVRLLRRTAFQSLHGPLKDRRIQRRVVPPAADAEYRPISVDLLISWQRAPALFQV